MFKTEHKNIKFTQADITNFSELTTPMSQTDSLTRLQAIGHFGLGCCFESVNIYGHQREILSLSKLLKRLRNFPSGM